MANQKHMPVAETNDEQSNADTKYLLEAAGVGLWTYDGGSNTFTLDATCRRLFDLDDDEELNMETMRDRIHPDDLEPYWTAVKESMEGGGFTVDYRLVRKDGSIRFISGRGRTVLAPGAPVQTKGVCIDVTDRHQLEARLHSTEDRLQHLADGVPGLFSYIDHEYRVQFMSSQYRSIFGRDADELVGKHIADIIGRDAFAERRPRYDAALAGQTVHHESSRVMPDGRSVYFTIAHVPHRDRAGEVCGVMSLAIDITDRRNIEEALQRKSDELERSNKDLEQFAYVASHDLKAPLRAIEVLVQWLREDLRDTQTGEVQENLGLLEQRTQRLNCLLDDLLEYSRAGRKVGDTRKVNTREMVADIATLLAPPAGLRVEADDSLPTLDAHAAPLEQVLRNLINNAIKHHPAEQGLVRVYAQDQGDSVMFAVEDDGAGIPQEYAEKVFQMFQTLQPRDDREGSGMGLAIVQRIIDWQGGRIWFHPGPGERGTVFKFIWNKLTDESVQVTPEGKENGNEAREHIAG